ncbi:hypothetical protein ACJX0J_008173, partial [Zea mays]
MSCFFVKRFYSILTNIYMQIFNNDRGEHRHNIIPCHYGTLMMETDFENMTNITRFPLHFHEVQRREKFAHQTQQPEKYRLFLFLTGFLHCKNLLIELSLNKHENPCILTEIIYKTHIIFITGREDSLFDIGKGNIENIIEFDKFIFTLWIIFIISIASILDMTDDTNGVYVDRGLYGSNIAGSIVDEMHMEENYGSFVSLKEKKSKERKRSGLIMWIERSV